MFDATNETFVKNKNDKRLASTIHITSRDYLDENG